MGGDMKKHPLGERRHEAKHGDCIFTREAVDVCPVHRKCAAIRAVAPYTVNMQRFAPSIEMPLATATSNWKAVFFFFKKKKAFEVRGFCFGRVSHHIDVISGQCKYAVIRAGGSLGGTL